MKVRITYDLNAADIVEIETDALGVDGPVTSTFGSECDEEETETPCAGCRKEYETDELTDDVTDDPSALIADAYAAANEAAQKAFNDTLTEYYNHLGEQDA